MENILRSVELSIETNNSYAALCVALTLPDICSAYEYPALAGSRNVGKRYKLWFNNHLASEYIQEIGADHHIYTFMNAEDFYAMRCSVLHEGRDDVSSDTRTVNSKFDFVTLPNGGMVHNNSFENDGIVKLNIQVEILCEQIIDQARMWWSTIDEGFRSSIDASLIKISRI
jgi:hypothetical protein